MSGIDTEISSEAVMTIYDLVRTSGPIFDGDHGGFDPGMQFGPERIFLEFLSCKWEYLDICRRCCGHFGYLQDGTQAISMKEVFSHIKFCGCPRPLTKEGEIDG